MATRGTNWTWNGSTRRRGRVAVFAFVLAVGPISACTSDESTDPVIQPASTAVVERTSGPLADGLEILADSALIGRVFERSGPHDWTAVLRIEGDPRQTLAAYQKQMERVLRVPVGPAFDVGCGREFVQPPFELLCHSTGATEEQSVVLTMPISEDDDRTYLLIESAALVVPPEQAMTPPALPGGPVAPATDEPLAAAYGADHMELRLVEGSRLLDDPVPNEVLAYYAVLEVTGDPAAVMRGYAAQFIDGEATLRGDDHQIVASLHQAGAAHITIQAILEEPVFLLVTYRYDA